MKAHGRKTLDQARKGALTSKISEFLSKEENVLFTYLYGSFLEERPFGDVDVAAYVDPARFQNPDRIFDYGISLAAKIDLAISGVSVDLRLLNAAPMPFRFNVITTGRVLFSRSEEERIDFEVKTRSLYFDFLPHINFYYKSIVLGTEDGPFRK
jgi:predicted nucleotidyltransferase